jgi:hypothetical protein
MPQAVAPDVEPDSLPEVTHNPQHASRVERAVPLFAPETARLKQRSCSCSPVRQIPLDGCDDFSGQWHELALPTSLPENPCVAAVEIGVLQAQPAEFADTEAETIEVSTIAKSRVWASFSPLVSSSIARISATVGPIVWRRRSGFTPGTSRYHVIKPSMRPSFETLRRVARCRLMLAADRCAATR